MSRWLPALRIARRTVLRSPGRSLLVALLVGLPVAGATALDLLVRTMASPEHRAQREIGSADAVAVGISSTRLAALVPRGTRIAPNPLAYDAFLVRPSTTIRTTLVTADVREPLHRHAARLDEGRAPSGAGEVLITRKLATRLHLLDGEGRLRGGATITMRRGPTAAVTGLARAPFCLDCAEVVATPGSEFARVTRRRYQGAAQYVDGVAPTLGGVRRGWLLDLPGGASLVELAAILNGAHAQFGTREQVLHPPPVFSSRVDAGQTLRDAALVTLLVGLGLLEIVLLAGTAFAVGARRQLRELGLVAASGGSQRDVRRIVLAQGLVLGALGAVAGVVAGVALAVAGRPLWESVYNEELTGWAVRTWEIAGLALVGLLSGLAAAVVPAVGAARMRPVQALAGRFREGRPRRRRNARMGAVLLVVGVGCGIVGHRVLSEELGNLPADVYAASQTASSDGGILPVVGGAALAVMGLVLLAPAIIGGLARLGRRLPLSARLAVRDAERQRHRTGPATGAITVAVAFAVLTASLIAMVFHADDIAVVPQLPDHVLAVASDAGLPAGSLIAAGDAAASQLPGARRYVVRQTLPGAGGTHLLAHDGDCTPERAQLERCRWIRGDNRLAVTDAASDAAAVTAGGELDGAARAALAAGQVVVFHADMLDRAGNVLVQSGVRQRPLPGHLFERARQYARLPSALVSPALARSQGWPTRIDRVLVTFDSDASSDAVDTALSTAVDDRILVFVTSGSGVRRGTILLIVALIAGLVTLLSVAISIALSAAEGRADLATLAAVGAPPRRRRSLVASQALLVGGLGGLLGVAVGTFVAFTARATTGSPDFVVPWWNLLAAGLGAPIVAALVAALCTRGRLPVVRRSE
jgi:putative ABC transport system permease protein